MRLKSLRLSGFKSFANPTTFNFSKNITAIVGPNGCGKSNVIDAIRWVLGESSAKQLRGGAMSDVIFAGTQTTSAKSLASVELTFEHTHDEQTGIRHELNIYHELAVRRQVNKEGKSDYFINGTRCRRRDVVDIFLGTGLGARSYAVIEQGMIGRIVDSNPMQLRHFIEEGAGVSRYQARRLETQKKLNQAAENLERLNDVKSELEKQQKTLAKQAETAQRHQELTEKLYKLEQDIAIHQLYTAKYTEQQQQQAYSQLNAQLDDEQTTLSTKNALLEKLASRISEQQCLKDDARDKQHTQQMSLQQAEHALGQHNSRVEQLVEKQTNFVTQEQDNQTQLSTFADKKHHEQEQLNQITPQVAELKNRKADIQTRLTPLIRQSQEIHTQRDELQSNQRHMEKELALLQQADSNLSNEQQKWTTKHSHWQRAWQELSETTDIDSIDTELNAHKNNLASVLRQYDDASMRLEDEQEIFTALKASVNLTQTELQTLEKHHATLNSEYNTLHALVYPVKAKKTAHDTVTHELTAINSLEQAHRLSDTIELTKQGQAHADILDTWLAMWLDGILVETLGSGSNTQHDWLMLLTQDQPAQDNNSILTINHVNTVSTTNKENLAVIELNDCLLPLTTLIKAPKLQLLQTAYLLVTADLTAQNHTQDIQIILQQHISHLPTGAYVITDTGWLAGAFGIIHVSKLSNDDGDSHFLRQREQQRTRLTELEEELNSIEEALETQQKQLKKSHISHDDKQIIIEELTAQVNNLQLQSHEHRQAITKLHASFERGQADNKRLTQEQEHLQQEQQQRDGEQKNINAQLVTLNDTLPMLNNELARVENERSHIRFQRSEADNQSREIDGALQSFQLQQQQLTLSIKHLDEQTSRLHEQLGRFSEEQQQLQNSIDTTETALPVLEKAVQEQQNICHQGQVTLDEHQAQLTEIQTEYNSLRDAFNKEQINVGKQQQRLAEMITKRAVAKERLNEACNRIDSLAHINNVHESSHKKILATLVYVPARYPMMSKHYHQPYLHQLQALIASGQDTIRFANATELVDIWNRFVTDTAETAQQSSGFNNKPILAVSSASLLTDFILHRSNQFDEELENSKQQQRQQDYQSLQIQIGRIGAVNLVAVAELQQVNDRLNPLSTQINDIVASMSKLTDAIRTIDNKTKELFLQALELVNKDLLYLFGKVFGGGQASLTLVDDDSLDKKDKWRAGLELMAQPKGKKNSRLAVLSGGEKTLTALSLVFAIFKQHPAPFCVLDEVDAPLDDANVGRFTALIEELASDLQFVFISHNKLSMQIADELKGITMPNAGISTLVSVNLDEAEQYIDQG